MKPSLCLLPLPIHEDYIDFATAKYRALLEDTDCIVAENIRTARRWVARLKIGKIIDDFTWIEIPKKENHKILPQIKQLWKSKKSVAIMSESGTPCVADPGHFIVQEAQLLNIKVLPLIGPNSILLALMASGMNGQSFTFCGYLPIKPNELNEAIRNAERLAVKQNQTQIFIETPYRNDKMLGSLLSQLNNSTMLCLATNITGADEQIITKSVGNWKRKVPTIGKQFCIFLIGK